MRSKKDEDDSSYVMKHEGSVQKIAVEVGEGESWREREVSVSFICSRIPSIYYSLYFLFIYPPSITLPCWISSFIKILKANQILLGGVHNNYRIVYIKNCLM